MKPLVRNAYEAKMPSYYIEDENELILPIDEVGEPDFDKAIKEASENDLPLICYEREGGKRFSEIDFKGKKTVSLIIGSEGGFDASEAEKAIDKGIIPIWLGERILRCETAPVAAISIIMNLSGNI